MRVHSVPVNAHVPGGGFRSEPTLDDPGPAGDADRFVADAKVDLEVASRRRERWIRQRLAEEATLTGALVGACGRDVALQLVTGDRIAGVLSQVGSDVVQVTRHHGSVWLATDAVAALEVGASVPTAEPNTTGVTFLEVLVDLAADRAEVVLTLVGGTAIRGELVAVGDVATVRTGPNRRTAYASLGAVACASVLA
jgi:hypothetical protein